MYIECSVFETESFTKKIETWNFNRNSRIVYTNWTGHPSSADAPWWDVTLKCTFDEGVTYYGVEYADYHIESTLSHRWFDAPAEAIAFAEKKLAEFVSAHAERNSPEAQAAALAKKLAEAKKEYGKLVKKAAKKGYKSGWVFFQLKEIFGYEVADAICIRNVI